MRKSRFIKATVQGAQGPSSISVCQSLLFDVLNHESADEFLLASRRVAAFEPAPILLAGTHVLVALAGIADHPRDAVAPSFGNPVFWLGIMLIFDAAAWFLIGSRAHLKLNAHTVTRALCGYIACSGLWCIIFGAVVLGQLHDHHEFAVPLALSATIGMNAIVWVRSPPLTTCNVIVAAAATLLFTDGPWTAAAIILLCMMFAAYVVADTQVALDEGKKQLALDAHAHKALHFVKEFEDIGCGWFWETDCEGTLSYVSQQLADDFECDAQELLGQRFTGLLSVDTESAIGAERKTLGFHLSARFPFSDVVVRAASDKEVYWSLSGNPIFDEFGRFRGFRGIGTDLTEQRRTQQEISRLARFDSLTGLPNRAMMRQMLEDALRNAAHRRGGCGLFLIDLDRFKNVNDTLGHPIGDALLREVSERLKSVMGEHGQVGRLGGDEFKAVLPGTVDVGSLESLAKKLIDHVSLPYIIEGHKILIGASVGIAIGNPGRCTADSLIRDSDLALYAAKADGRGKYKIFEQSMHSEASDRQLLENDLRQATDRGELRVVYQPIVRAAGEEISGFEALVRWEHSTRGSISPTQFIPLAEECGIISRIGTWVLETAVAEAARWPDNVRVAVNLSPIQFNDPSIVQTVEAALRRNGVRGERLELEITEGVFLADSDATDTTFARLKALGVRLALDDFGTGYSSLGYLKKAPFDKIKIDQSFVRGASSTTSRNSAIIRAIVTLAETLGMDTCAEGVETHDDLNLIRELGCSHIQGFIFGRPVAEDEALKLARSKSLEADGYKCIREPRQRLMRRGIAAIDGQKIEIRLRNISAMGALIECANAVAPGERLTIDIVGVGPVVGVVRWAQSGRFGMHFDEQFELTRLAPKKQPVKELSPWYVEPRQTSLGS